MRAFKFTPLLKSMIWGGNRIASYKGIAVDRSDIGESWELSGVKGDESVVAEGEYAGMTLPELIGQLKGELVGHAVYERHGTEFPLLVKFIDARQDLSIQVHPNDVLARMRHGKNGKTEMWYVVAADRGAHLKSGFSEQLTPAEYERKVADHTLTDALCDYSVTAGDLFFLPPAVFMLSAPERSWRRYSRLRTSRIVSTTTAVRGRTGNRANCTPSWRRTLSTTPCCPTIVPIMLRQKIGRCPWYRVPIS